MTHTRKRGGLTKLRTGIQGFDYITGGGLPRGRTTMIMGGPGAGKTVFALQTLVAGATRGEPGVLVTFQESPRQIVEDAAAFGWDLAEMEKNRLVILDARIRPNVLKSIELYLTGMLAGVKLVSGEMGARRIVFDSLDALLSLLGDRTAERHEMFRIRDWLLDSGLTAVVTMQADGDDPLFAQRHGFMQFMADCVVSLHHQPRNSEPSRSLRVLKYRGSAFIEEEFPLSIGNSGVEVGFAPAGAAHSKLQRELKEAGGKLKDRLESFNKKLEVKKAELEFLAKSGAAHAGIQHNSTRSTSSKSRRRVPRRVAPTQKASLPAA